jgi:hypothetical protein
MTKWLHVSAMNEPSSGQFCSDDQLHIENVAHYGIPYAIQVIKVQLKDR